MTHKFRKPFSEFSGGRFRVSLGLDGMSSLRSAKVRVEKLAKSSDRKVRGKEPV